MKAEVVERGKERYTVVEVPSFSNPSTMYRVDVVNQRCSCPAWKFSKEVNGRRPMCKHMIQLGFKAVAITVPVNYEEHL